MKSKMADLMTSYDVITNKQLSYIVKQAQGFLIRAAEAA